MDLNKTEIKEVQTKIGVKCDCCGRERIYRPFSGREPNEEWFHYSTHTDMWGNDSHESYEFFDVCSFDCFKRQLVKHVDDLSDGYYISDLPYSFAKRIVNG